MTQTEQQTIQQIAADIGADVTLVRAAITGYKAAGFSGLAAQSGTIVPAIRRDVADMRVALPIVKAGYQTTEFWAIVLAASLNVIIPMITGHAVPIDVNATIGALVGIYTVVRGLLKGGATTAPTIIHAAPSAIPATSPTPPPSKV